MKEVHGKIEISRKSRALDGAMYKKTDKQQKEFEDFLLPFGGKLSGKNRWVVKASLIPWDELEPLYEASLTGSHMGAPAISFRIAFGSQIIKESLNITDEETVEQIRENPYLQYFLGYTVFTTEKPFDASMMVHFRKRLKWNDLQAINDRIAGLGSSEASDDDQLDPPTGTGSSKEAASANQTENAGTLKVDATCTPADIRYPTDLSLVEEARRKSEKLIDMLYAAGPKVAAKPRTYRKKARKHFLSIIRKRRKSSKEIRKAIGKQLRFLKRNLKSIRELATPQTLATLSKAQYKALLVIHEVYRQQLEMFESETHKIDGRIVSIRQPHVRPIVRGKAGADTEFGAKISMSIVDGYVYVDRISFDAFNEGGDLAMQLEEYKRRFGKYPAVVQADKIYRTRSNHKLCKDNNIRLSGPALGRPPKDEVLRKLKKQIKSDEGERVEIEGGFGVLKRKYSWDEIRARLPATSITWICMAAIARNIEKAYRAFLSLLCWIFNIRSNSAILILIQ